MADPYAGGRISRGIRLMKVSWAVVRADKALVALPLISALVTIVMYAGLVGAALGIGGVPTDSELQNQQLPPAYYVALFIGYFLATFVTVYFNAVVIGMATIRLRGGDPKMSDGFRLANSKLPKILGWALLTATVGMILRAISERAGIIGRIVIGIIGFVWAVATFFVVPVLLYEPVGVFGGVKRSAGIFKERWGEQFTGNIGIGLILFLIALPTFLVLGAVTFVAWPVGIVLMVLAIGLFVGVGGAMSGVFNAALYQYATSGQTGFGFTEGDLQSAFRPKKR